MQGSEPSHRGQGDEERLYKTRGPKYTRVPSKSTLTSSTTSSSLATTCGSQGVLVPNYATIPEHVSTESSSEDEKDSFENTRRHFQQLRQISLGNEFKYKMEMEIKNEKEDNLKNSSPFVKQLSLDSNKVTQDFAINSDANPYMPTTQRLYLWTQVSKRISKKYFKIYNMDSFNICKSLFVMNRLISPHFFIAIRLLTTRLA